jgi:hypothetical protein
MKFGKKLTSAEGLSPDAWHGTWLNYKKLKKVISAIVDEQSKDISPEIGGRQPNRRCTNSKEMGTRYDYSFLSSSRPHFSLNTSPPARYTNVRSFFKCLNDEINKIATFFGEQERKLSVKATSVSLLADRAVQNDVKGKSRQIARPTAHDETMQECVAFHKGNANIQKTSNRAALIAHPLPCRAANVRELCCAELLRIVQDC